MPLKVQTFIFECMAVHNATQCCYNLYCCSADFSLKLMNVPADSDRSTTAKL